MVQIRAFACTCAIEFRFFKAKFTCAYTREQSNTPCPIVLTAISDDGARLDVAASGVWGNRFERTFVDIRVFNPLAQSNQAQSLTATYTKHEKE